MARLGEPERILVGTKDQDPLEVAASNFAAEILMPEKLFREAVRTLEGNIQQVADRFGVTNLAVRRRAAMLGMKGHKLGNVNFNES